MSEKKIWTSKTDSIDLMAAKVMVVLKVACRYCGHHMSSASFSLAVEGRTFLGKLFDEGWRGISEGKFEYALCPNCVLHIDEPRETRTFVFRANVGDQMLARGMAPLLQMVASGYYVGDPVEIEAEGDFLRASITTERGFEVASRRIQSYTETAKFRLDWNYMPFRSGQR